MNPLSTEKLGGPKRTHVDIITEEKIPFPLPGFEPSIAQPVASPTTQCRS